MTRQMRNALMAVGAATLMLSAWGGADDTDGKGGRAAKPEVGAKDAITPEMVRRISGPGKPDNGVVDVQPGLPAKKCEKEHKADKGGDKGERDKRPEKTGRRKGHC
jgi:hypothetical protein